MKEQKLQLPSAGAGTPTTSESHYLYVDAGGNIVGDKWRQQNLENFETWACTYAPSFLTLLRVYPTVGEPVKLQISSGSRQIIGMKRSNHLANIPFLAKHEAGHAIMCYVLRLGNVNLLNLRFIVIPDGNLYRMIEKSTVDRLYMIKGTTDIPLSSPGLGGSLRWAVQALGGIAGCNGDETGAEKDLTKFREFLMAAMPESRRSEIPFLQDKLQRFANEILQDPLICSRHEELALSLSQGNDLNTKQIEAILRPESLPDLSEMILKIGGALGISAGESVTGNTTGSVSAN